MTGLKGFIVVYHSLDMKDQVKYKNAQTFWKKVVKMFRKIKKAGEYHI